MHMYKVSIASYMAIGPRSGILLNSKIAQHVVKGYSQVLSRKYKGSRAKRSMGITSTPPYVPLPNRRSVPYARGSSRAASEKRAGVAQHMATDEHYSVARRACACYGASTNYSHSVRTIGYKNLLKSARIGASSDGAYSYRSGLQITM